VGVWEGGAGNWQVGDEEEEKKGKNGKKEEEEEGKRK